MKKIVIIGASQAGLSAVRMLMDAGGYEVVIYDRESSIGFLSGGMPLWVNGTIRDSEFLFYTNPVKLSDSGARIHTEFEVTDIDFSKHKISVRDKFGRSKEESYDKLILATGSRSMEYPVSGMDLSGIHSAKRFKDASESVRAVSSNTVRKVGIVGGGCIGVELADACVKRGKEVVLFEVEDTLLRNYFDREYSHFVENQFRNLGVTLKLGCRIQSFRGDSKVEAIVTNKGTEEVDLVYFCAGFYPVAELGDGLERTECGAYKVNEYQLTNHPDVYAVGDCSANYHQNLMQHHCSFYASNAIRTGVIAAAHIMGHHIPNPGTQDSTALCIGGLYMGSTGLTYRMMKSRGIPAKFTEFKATQFPEFMQGDNPEVCLRIVYRSTDRVIVGAQISSRYDMTSSLNYYSLAIQEGVSMEELSLMDLFFMPHFNQAYNYHQLCALSAT